MKTFVIMLSKVFPKGHRREGEPTGFKEKLLFGDKIHTIRSSYGLWKKRIEEVQKGDAIISVRQWEGLPYRSRQREIFRFTRFHEIGIERLSIWDLAHAGTIGSQIVELPFLAKNDGLGFNDFYSWFRKIHLQRAFGDNSLYQISL